MAWLEVMADSKYNFIAEPDSSLQCVICLEVAEEPRQHERCGRLLCEECLEKLGRDKPCPYCRMEQPQYFQDNRSKREIMALRVRCNISECAWEGTVGTLQEHSTKCEFLAPCPKQCKDANDKVAVFMRKALDEHLKMQCPNRDYACQNCGIEGSYVDITQVHDIICGKKIIPCPNADCDETMERQQVPEHVGKCPHTVLPCKYQGIGCGVELERKDLAAHEQDDKLHLHMALETVNSQQGAINSQQVAINSQQVTINSLNGTVNSQQAAIDTLVDTTKGQESAINSLQGTLKLQQDAIKLLNEKHNTDISKEPITFALARYREKKQAGEIVQFPSFYTHLNGYHMALVVFTDGYGIGKGTHVSVFIKILEGKYDAGLTWPFIGSATFTLLNQLKDDNHHSDTIPFRAEQNIRPGNSWGRTQFISQMDLDPGDSADSPRYLKDDTLYFRVSVGMTNRKPWLQYTSEIKTYSCTLM